jgi:hypothetical protein
MRFLSGRMRHCGFTGRQLTTGTNHPSAEQLRTVREQREGDEFRSRHHHLDVIPGCLYVIMRVLTGAASLSDHVLYGGVLL